MSDWLKDKIKIDNVILNKITSRNVREFFDHFTVFPCKAFKKHFKYLTETE